MLRIRSTPAATAVLLAASLLRVHAADYQIRMLNHGPDGQMQFSPQLLRIAPGDTVHFMAVDKGHNAQSIDGMLPEGAKPFSGPVSADFSVTLRIPGVYGYRCMPHGALGMVGLIVVGEPVNEAAAKSIATPGLAGHVFSSLFKALDADQAAAK